MSQEGIPSSVHTLSLLSPCRAQAMRAVPRAFGALATTRTIPRTEYNAEYFPSMLALWRVGSWRRWTTSLAK